MWYSTFIEHYSSIAEPLYRLFKKGVPWHWGEAQQKAFEKIKSEMEKHVYLTGIDYNYPIICQVDASKIGIGCCLKQEIDGKERIIECRSALFNESQRKWITYEQECFAIVWALRKFHDLIGGQKIIVETDNQAVTWMKRNPSKKAKVERWSIELEEYDYELRHIKGKNNIMADMLSRAPPEQQETDHLLDAIADGEHIPCINVLRAYLTRQELVDAQLVDEECSQIITKIRSPGRSEELKLFEIVDNMLMRRVPKLSMYKIKKEKKMLESKKIDKKAEKALTDKRSQLYCMLKERKTRLEKGSQMFLNVLPFVNNSGLFSKKMELRRQVALRKVNDKLNRSILVLHANDAVKVHSSKEIADLEKLTTLVPVVPVKLRSKVISCFHDVPECAHLGFKRTRHAIMKRFWWRGMTKDIREFVKSCSVCQTVKCANKLPCGLMGHKMNKAEAMETVFVDIIGRLPTTRYKNEYILVVQDEYTKWVEFFPMRDSTAPTIIKFLEDEVFCRFGFPRKIVSDNGTQFVGNIFDDLCKRWGISHKKVAYYAPWGNAVERSNRDLRAMISSFAEKRQRVGCSFTKICVNFANNGQR